MRMLGVLYMRHTNLILFICDARPWIAPAAAISDIVYLKWELLYRNRKSRMSYKSCLS